MLECSCRKLNKIILLQYLQKDGIYSQRHGEVRARENLDTSALHLCADSAFLCAKCMSGSGFISLYLQARGGTHNTHLRTFFTNSHIHMIASDGLFLNNGLFYVMPLSIALKPLEDIFQATILKMRFRGSKKLGKGIPGQ